MTCETSNGKLDQYVDAELPAKEQAALDEHIQGCTRCSVEALNRFKMKQATQIVGHRFEPTPEFRERIRSQIASKKPRSRAFGWIPAFAAVAALLTVALISTIVLNQRAQRQHLLTEVADIHISNLASSSPVDVVSTDRHTVKPWFQGKLPFTFNLPELTNTEFSLVGGKVVYLEHEPAALLVFKYRSHYLSVFVLQDRAPVSNLGSAATKEASFSVESWEDNGLRYLVITDASSGEATALARLLKDAAKT